MQHVPELLVAGQPSGDMVTFLDKNVTQVAFEQLVSEHRRRSER